MLSSVIFYWIFCFDNIKPHELFVNFGEYFIPVFWLFFYFACDFLCFAKDFEFNYASFVYFLFLFLLFWEMGKKRYDCNLCQSVLPVFSSGSFILSGLTFRASLRAHLVKNLPVMQETLVPFLGREDPLEKG